MDIIQISDFREIPAQPRRQPQQGTRKKRPTPAARIIGAAIRIGLFAGTVALVFNAVVWAAEVTQGRLSIPGGEIFTIPFIVALFAAGYVLRGDVEAMRRRRRQEQRRRANEQRSK